MIIQMKKYTFLVFHRDYEPFLTQLRDLGVVDITLKSAGLIENDEALQAALQHEDELRRLLKQGAPDQLIQERANIEQRIAEAGQEAEKAAVWGDFDSARIQALKEAGYTLRFFACPEKTYREEWGIKVAEKEGKTYFVVVDNSTSRNIEIPFEYHDTICRNVANRVKELQDFARANDLVLFVGGTKSSNARVLYKQCVEANPNTFFVSSPDEINSLRTKWSGSESDLKIGICGATSTPLWLMEECKKQIEYGQQD